MDPEELSYRNLVQYYREGLEQLQAGARAMDAFTRNERRILRNRGILDFDNYRHVKHRVCGKAASILENLDK